MGPNKSEDDEGLLDRLRHMSPFSRKSRSHGTVQTPSAKSSPRPQPASTVVKKQILRDDSSTSAHAASSSTSIPQAGASTTNILPCDQTQGLQKESTDSKNDNSQHTQITSHKHSLDQNPPKGQLTQKNHFASAIGSSDLWSAAYREAVENFEAMDMAFLEGKSVAQLFQSLEDMEKDATSESAFSRGVKYLHSLQIPLETLKLALDVASPLSNIEPTAATVVGVLRSVTAVR